MTAWAIGIDIGGTFTDLVALHYETGKLYSLKVLTTHTDPTQGVADGAAQLMAKYGVDPAAVIRIVHATTLFTNALIERRGCKTGLLITQGFKDIIEMGNERKYDLYDLTLDRAPPLVPRALRGEVSGRLDAAGTELEPLDIEKAARTIDELVNAGVESIAICLLHSYRFNKHEQQLRELIVNAHPGIAVTLSSDVAPVIREYERISTTVANAYIKPLAQGYLDTLEERLAVLGLDVQVLMMLSNGGLSHLLEAKANPIVLLESGPAAGAISAAHYCLLENQQNLLAFDMGGTTAKLCLVEGGKPAITFGFEAARRKRFAEGSGIPLSITTVDLIEIGAGGGSIAYEDQLGLLKVGPHSAGSEPGPACYGLGGQEPTVTDANLLLGYLNPGYFAGGTLSIDTALAHASLEKVGQQLATEVTDIAWGIHDIVAENMAAAARVHVAERGRDPRDFVLVATGGGGPVHSYYVAQKIGVKTIVCPPAAGVASAFGLLVAPARTDRSRTVSFKPASDSLQALETVFSALESEVQACLQPLSETFGPIHLVRRADGRFTGQGFNLSVTLPGGPYRADDEQQEIAVRAELDSAFRSEYRHKFGRTPPNVPIELVNLRVMGEAPPRRIFESKPLDQLSSPQPKAIRPVYFREARGYVETPVYDRDQLPLNFVASGPLLIEELSTTLVVGPHGELELTASGNLVITIQENRA